MKKVRRKKALKALWRVTGGGKGDVSYGFGKVLTTIESWPHLSGLASPFLLLLRAESMPLTAMPRVRVWKGCSSVALAAN